MSWTTDQAKALAERILSFSKAPECEVSLRLSQTGHTRFAANEITTAGMVRERLGRDHQPRRRARAARPRPIELDESLLREAVARSEALMAAAQPDPEHVESLGPQRLSHDPCVRRRHRRRRPGRAPRRRQGRPRPRARRRPERLGLFRDRRPLAGRRQQERQLRLPPRDGRRIFDHDAHRGRHRLGLRAIGSPRLADLRGVRRSPSVPRRRPRLRPNRASWPRALHRHPRARGGRRSAGVLALLAECSHRRRGPQLLVEARRWHAAG